MLVEELQDGGVGQVVRHRPLGLGADGPVIGPGGIGGEEGDIVGEGAAGAGLAQIEPVDQLAGQRVPGPGDDVFGIMVSPISSRNVMSSSLNEGPPMLGALVQPERNSSPPISALPVAKAIIFKSSLRSMVIV